MTQKYESQSSFITKKFAALFAQELIHSKLKNKNAFIIGLIGNLGSGKTTFIQGFARGLGIKYHLTSPTFLIIRSYSIPKSYILNSKFSQMYHIDCYRIKKTKELNILGFKQIIADPKNVVVIEWADKIRKLLPQNTLWLKFKHGQKENERILTVQHKC